MSVFDGRPLLRAAVVLLCVADLLALGSGVFLVGAQEGTGTVTGVRSQPSHCGPKNVACYIYFARIRVDMDGHPSFFEVPTNEQGGEEGASSWQPGRRLQVLHNDRFPELGYEPPALGLWTNSAFFLALGLAFAAADGVATARRSGPRRP